ncbi:hypothetical protein R1sor_023582 [Riccia sorocarpa]|uniref:Reverse transcriptase zinc-binding domain-containing protein n=1 Tax=Riccia sorocarpa TaxID=122646 RepID=A0ABD3GPW2_9MARC
MECASRTKELLDCFGNATGLEIQWEKSTARWLGPNKLCKPDWVAGLTWSWKEPGETTKLLGFTFEEELKADAMLLRCYRRLGDLINTQEDGVAAWEDRSIKGTQTRNAQKAYEGLIEAVHGPRILQGREDEVIRRCFEDTQNSGMVWEWPVQGSEKYRAQEKPDASICICGFQEAGSTLTMLTTAAPPVEGRLYQPVDTINYRIGQGKVYRIKADCASEEARELAMAVWENETPFFEASNGQIRQMLGRNQEAVKIRLNKWEGVLDFNLDDPRRWKAIWKSGRAKKESFLLWSICYKIVPTNAWRFPALPDSDPQRWCRRCDRNEVESTLHTFWSCPKAERTWNRVQSFFSEVQDPVERWHPQINHVLVA